MNATEPCRASYFYFCPAGPRDNVVPDHSFYVFIHGTLAAPICQDFPPVRRATISGAGFDLVDVRFVWTSLSEVI